MRRVLALFWMAAVTVLPVHAQQTAAAEASQALPADAPSREQILKTFVHPEQLQQKMTEIFELMRQQVKQRLQHDGNASPELLKFMDDTFDAMVKNISVDDIVNALVAVYQSRFTTSDINAIADFEATSAGEKFRNGQKEILTLTMQAMDPEKANALAAKPLPANAPSKEQMTRLFDAIQIRKSLQAMIRASRQQSKAVVADTLKDRGIDPGEAMKSMDEKENDPALDRAINAEMLVYRRYFTAAEIESMTAFYLSPAGQKFMAATPEIAAASTKAVAPMVRKVMESVMDRLSQRDRELRQKQN